jgi:hypothetical protein
MPLYFFFLAASVIILKNIGVTPFLWLGSLPLFDQVWSLRWAGPVWTFAMSAAGAIGLQMILPEKAYKLDGDELLNRAPARMAPHPMKRKIDQYLQRKPYMPVVFSFLIVAIFYIYAVLIDTVMLVLRSEEIFNARMEPVIGPSIGGAVIVFFVILVLFLFFGTGVSRSGKGNGFAAFVMLAALELWWAVPRGYSPDTLGNKWILFVIGIFVVIFFYKQARVLALIVIALFFAATLYLDINAPNGLPERSDPFKAPPYVEFIKGEEGHFRVAGSYGTLMPNFASSVGLLDVHYVNSLIPKDFHSYRTNYLHADLIEEEPVSSLWFTGRPERCEVVGDSGGYRHHIRPVEDDFLRALKGYSLLGVKYFITPPWLSLGRVFPLVYRENDVLIYKNPIVLDRAWVVRDLRLAVSSDDAQAKVFDKDFYPSRSAVVEDSGVIERLKEDDIGAAITDSVKIIEYEPMRVVIQAEFKRSGLLILSDTFYPGWEVEVNNAAKEPVRVDGLFRGVELSAGKSTVVWSYRPLSFMAGVILSGLSIIICFVFFIIRKREA